MNQLYNLEQTFKSVQEILQAKHFLKIYKEFEQEIGSFKKALRNFQKDLPIYDMYSKDPSVLWHLGIKDYFEIDITNRLWK